MAVAKKGFEFFLNRLLKGFRSVEKREPNNLEMILIRQEARNKAIDANKVIDVKFGKPFSKEIEAMIKSGDVKVGKADKTPPYQKSQADIEFEIMEIEDFLKVVLSINSFIFSSADNIKGE